MLTRTMNRGVVRFRKATYLNVHIFLLDNDVRRERRIFTLYAPDRQAHHIHLVVPSRHVIK
jgi:hypothetical protein